MNAATEHLYPRTKEELVTNPHPIASRRQGKMVTLTTRGLFLSDQAPHRIKVNVRPLLKNLRFQYPMWG
tara:strand:- start:78 stop:284 length:207 start_codon:yes stop_codon:yes gene_type:complete